MGADDLTIVLILIGLATGALTGLTGASGMSILISALLLVGIEIRQVIGLTFVVTLTNAIVALGFYIRHGQVNFRVGFWVALPAVAAVMLGHRFADQVDPASLTGLMVVCLFFIGTKFVVSPGDRKTEQEAPSSRPHAGPLMVMGMLVGFIMGIMGGGGAVFISLAFILLFRIETKVAIGTSILVMGLAAIPGTVSHAAGGTVSLFYASSILAASIPASFLSSWFANRVSKELVKRLLGVYLVAISTLLLYRMLSA